MLRRRQHVRADRAARPHPERSRAARRGGRYLSQLLSAWHPPSLQAERELRLDKQGTLWVRRLCVLAVWSCGLGLLRLRKQPELPAGVTTRLQPEERQSTRTCRQVATAISFWLATNGRGCHEHNRTCRPRIARCARAVATSAADRGIVDAAPRQCTRAVRWCSETAPARCRHQRDPCRECVWRKANPRSDLSPGHVRRPTARHRTHPWRGLRDGRAGNEGCGE